jgi:hypothetical protein
MCTRMRGTQAVALRQERSMIVVDTRPWHTHAGTPRTRRCSRLQSEASLASPSALWTSPPTARLATTSPRRPFFFSSGHSRRVPTAQRHLCSRCCTASCTSTCTSCLRARAWPSRTTARHLQSSHSHSSCRHAPSPPLSHLAFLVLTLNLGVYTQQEVADMLHAHAGAQTDAGAAAECADANRDRARWQASRGARRARHQAADGRARQLLR